MDQVDVAIIGAGTGGEVCAHRLAKAGLRVAIVERDLIGGECDYWACMPSKALIRPTSLLGQIALGVGLETPGVRWPDVVTFRDAAVQHLDDTPQVHEFEREGVLFIRAQARFDGPGRVVAGDRVLAARHVVIATGSEPRIPPIDGLEESGYWTNREATLLHDVPESIAIVGGSAQALEMAAMLRRFGASVTMVVRSATLLSREDPALGELVADYLRDMGISLALQREVKRVERDAAGERVLRLNDGSTIQARELLLATGRKPRTDGVGLERVGVSVGKRGIEVDGVCRAAPGIWAVGDVTGVALFTHVANYQARIVADDILGNSHPANYTGIPRVVFAEPEIAAVGMTPDQARQQGIDLATSQIDLRETISRPMTFGARTSGTLALLADRERGVLVGAWAIAPQAGEWVHIAALAIRARVPVPELRDMIYQFPTFSEGMLYATDALDL